MTDNNDNNNTEEETDPGKPLGFGDDYDVVMELGAMGLVDRDGEMADMRPFNLQTAPWPLNRRAFNAYQEVHRAVYTAAMSNIETMEQELAAAEDNMRRATANADAHAYGFRIALKLLLYINGRVDLPVPVQQIIEQLRRVS